MLFYYHLRFDIEGSELPMFVLGVECNTSWRTELVDKVREFARANGITNATVRYLEQFDNDCYDDEAVSRLGATYFNFLDIIGHGARRPWSMCTTMIVAECRPSTVSVVVNSVPIEVGCNGFNDHLAVAESMAHPTPASEAITTGAWWNIQDSNQRYAAFMERRKNAAQQSTAAAAVAEAAPVEDKKRESALADLADSYSKWWTATAVPADRIYNKMITEEPQAVAEQQTQTGDEKQTPADETQKVADETATDDMQQTPADDTQKVGDEVEHKATDEMQQTPAEPKHSCDEEEHKAPEEESQMLTDDAEDHSANKRARDEDAVTPSKRDGKRARFDQAKAAGQKKTRTARKYNRGQIFAKAKR